jgi:hypothetical protein
MAGDWIKVEASTPEKAEVLAITARMGWDDADLTVGKLFRLWRWFDQQTVDGNAATVTTALLDRIVGVIGFCEAVRDAGWLTITDEGISLPGFDKHNGNTAKSRSMTAKRVAKHKASGGYNAKGNAPTVSGALPREEKRREEKNKDQKPLFDAFESFWKMYPAKKGKTPARKAWAKAAKSPEVIQQIMQGLANHLTCRQWTKDGGEYIPNPSSWLNQERWNDEVSHGPANTERSRPLSAVERVAAKAAERECQRQRVVEEPDGFLEGEYSRAN